MRTTLLAATVLALGPGPSWAYTIHVSDDNSTLSVNIDDNNVAHFPRKLQWNVNGKEIVVYPSNPSGFLDVGHSHFGFHVGPNQIHLQGPLFGLTGVTGGVVYTLDGATGSTSTLSEKVDVRNRSGGPVDVPLVGLGAWFPNTANLPAPNLDGFIVTGTTVVSVQGNTMAASLIDGPPYAPFTLLPVVSFTGLNPLSNQSFSLPDGATLTMITELKALDIRPFLEFLRRISFPRTGRF
jgi:hypothetical protein